MNTFFKGFETALPNQRVTNQELHEENPEWEMARTERRTGVKERFIANSNETALDLAESACQKLFHTYPDLKKKIDGILFCTQSPDYIMPPNSCILHARLELSKDVFATDFNHACSGYIYGLAIAHGLIQSGQLQNILLVTGDTYSRYIHPKDRSARVLFGDGASVTWISAEKKKKSLFAIKCETGGKHYSCFMIPAGGARTPCSEETKKAQIDHSGNHRTDENIQMDGQAVLSFVKSKVPNHVRDFLKSEKVGLDEIDLFVFHQASQMVLDSLIRLLKIPREKVFCNLEKIGNTVSSSIPIALKEIRDAKKLQPGNRVLICGFGVGLSWGSALIEL